MLPYTRSLALTGRTTKDVLHASLDGRPAEWIFCPVSLEPPEVAVRSPVMRRRASSGAVVVALTTLALLRCSAERVPVVAATPDDAQADQGDERGAVIDAGARVRCAERSPAPRCLGCAADEECFTHVSCGPLPEGGSACSDNGAGGDAAAADDSCHRRCEVDSECPAGERCVHLQYTGCVDFNGGPKGKGLCCRGNADCR